MALTNAERQAAFKARRAETMDALAQQNAALLAEVAELRAELDALKEKAHRLEVAALKAQLKAAQPEKVEAVKRPAVKKAAKRG
jgi:regulator of replication initiation timing